MILRHRALFSQFQQYRYYITIAQIKWRCNIFEDLNWRFRVRLFQQMIYKCEYNIMETVLLRPVSYHRSKVLCSLAGLGQSKRTRIFFCTENTAQTFSSVLSVSSVVKFF